jgi:hypothetical protein
VEFITNIGSCGKRRWTWRDIGHYMFPSTYNEPQQITMKVVTLSKMLPEYGNNVLNVDGKCSCQLHNNNKNASIPPYYNIKNNIAIGGHCRRVDGLGWHKTELI